MKQSRRNSRGRRGPNPNGNGPNLSADIDLAGLPEDAARRTLLALPSVDGYRLDSVLQGSDETVFFAL